MGKFFGYIIPSFGVFYNKCYAIKGFKWFNKVNGEIIKSCYSSHRKVGDKVVMSAKYFFKIKYHENFPFDLYDRY